MKAFTFLVITLTVLLASCSNQGLTPNSSPEQLARDKGYQLAEPVKAIIHYKIDGWRYINQQSLIINTGIHKDYLVILKNRCHGLSSTETIGTTATGTSMRAKFDAIIVGINNSNGSLNHSNTHKCYIDQLFKLNKSPKE